MLPLGSMGAICSSQQPYQLPPPPTPPPPLSARPQALAALPPPKTPPSPHHRRLLTVEMQKAESRKLLIGNIHVVYNPTRGEVKLGQAPSFTFMFIHLLISMAKILSERWGNAPVVLCGGFNSTPQV
ncbi:hypothetical protein D8674_040866 [Pyrus ussuriensis x Pyrus communis]|uniref:Uncharacterized protein n=1 Tax=Pyrus ussuriensis x Pyrus communis TaxID=2448454 RepID=A0A5N5H035_9ROSA|nr:hypothetical protein D8674_040866 [Pyrus ussuriensis x Pyrus communis]